MSAKQFNSMRHQHLPAMVLRFLLLAVLLVLTGCSTLSARQTTTLTTLGFNKVDDGWKLILPERVLFDFDKADVKPPLRASIADAAHQLLAVNIQQIRVEGHTDNIGALKYNQELSVRRANNVANVFVAEGFSQANVESKGYGPDRPAASNATEAGRAENRRVEIIVLSSALVQP